MSFSGLGLALTALLVAADHLSVGASGIVASEGSSNAPATADAFLIEVAAARNFSSVKLNGKYIHYEDHWDPERSGLHMLVLHPVTGAVMLRRFNPGHFRSAYTDIMHLLQRVQPGRIVILCSLHEAAFSLEPVTRRFFADAAPQLSILGTGSRYAMVRRWQGAIFAEAHLPRHVLNDVKEPLMLTTTVPVRPDLGEPCDWPDRTRASLRTAFCDQHEGFGQLCNCSDPEPLDRPFSPLLHNRTFHYPIAILASTRATFLFRTLQRLLPNRGLNQSLVTVFLQHHDQRTLDLLQILAVRAVVKPTPAHQKGGKISQNLKNAIQTSFELFPDADKMVVLEDDLYVSPDFVSYFAQTAPLLDRDVTLYCISAWNDISYKHSSSDPTLLYRTSYFPGLGWMMKKSILIGEMMPLWKPAWDDWDWDMWFRTEAQAQFRECVVPDVSRTYHFAYLGGHVYSYLQYMYYEDKSLNTVPDVEINITGMTYPEYRGNLFKSFSQVRLPPHKEYYKTCFEMFPVTEDPEERKRPYALIFNMKHAYDVTAAQNIMTCLGLWDLDLRGEHEGVWRFFINGNPVLAIGIPHSEYSDTLMQAVGITPVFNFKQYDLKRMRVPSPNGGNPKVTIFGTDNDEDEYYDEDDYTVNHWDPYEPDSSENTVDIQAK